MLIIMWTIFKEVKTMNEELVIQKIERDPTDKLCQIMSEKRVKNTQLNFAINDYTSLKLQYLQKSNDLLLNTDFEEVLGKKRPTVGEKEAYIENALFTLKSELTIAKENVNSIKRDIELLNDEIRLYELEIQMRLQE